MSALSDHGNNVNEHAYILEICIVFGSVMSVNVVHVAWRWIGQLPVRACIDGDRTARRVDRTEEGVP
jgi:hypothetical protein